MKPIPRIYVDFNNSNREGRVRLNTIGSIRSLNSSGVVLESGLEVELVSADFLPVNGVLEVSETEAIWVARFDLSELREQSPSVNIEAVVGKDAVVELPTTAEEVLAIIVKAEQHRKFAWTAGRLLKESALWTQVEALDFEDRKRVLKGLTSLMQELASRGLMVQRQEPRSIGFGNEIGFDFVRHGR